MIFGYHYDMWTSAKMKVPIKHSISTHCHILLTGSSGSGKSYALLYFLGKLLQDCPSVVLYFCDFKNSEDFRFMNEYSYYFAGDECYSGIIKYYESFTTARKRGYSNARHILICDEYPAFISYLQAQDKANKTKYSNDILSIVSELLMLGRGLSYGVYMTCQRADSGWFASGARENFMITICLGRISKEQKTMLFAGEDLPKDRIYKRGEGIIYADGTPIQEIKIPIIQNIDSWKKHILLILRMIPGRSPGEKDNQG